MAVHDHAKLFRAIVIMGASLTASGCGDKCAKCAPVDAAHDTVVIVDASGDAGIDGAAADARADAVIIL